MGWVEWGRGAKGERQRKGDSGIKEGDQGDEVCMEMRKHIY